MKTMREWIELGDILSGGVLPIYSGCGFSEEIDYSKAFRTTEEFFATYPGASVSDIQTDGCIVVVWVVD